MSLPRKALLIFVCWTLVGLYFSVHSLALYSYLGRPLPFAYFARIHLTCAYTWALFTPFLLILSKRWPLSGRHRWPHVALHMAAALIFSSLSLFIVEIVHLFVNGEPLHDWSRGWSALMYEELHGDILRYWAVIVIDHTLGYYRRMRDRELTASQLRAELAESKLEVLKRQLHPHFLFNTLNSISVLMFEDVKVANRMLLRLSEILRHGLTDDSPHEVSLERELRFLERYLEIERMRFGDRLTIDMNVDPTSLGARVPNLILQPLVENAIRYGVAAVDRPSRVAIRAEKQGEELKLEVRDDGPGLARNAKRGIGLSNTEARLRQMYGTEQKLELTSPAAGGLLVSISIPFRMATA
ncbi:MAG TPA: histidine kinase [Thermoanaerobaculia bacterium]